MHKRRKTPAIRLGACWVFDMLSSSVVAFGAKTVEERTRQARGSRMDNGEVTP